MMELYHDFAFYTPLATQKELFAYRDELYEICFPLSNLIDFIYLKNQFMQTITRESANDRLKIGEYVLSFLKEDVFCKELMSDYFQQWASNGFIESFCKIHFNQAPESISLIPWFMNRVFIDISSLQNSSKDEFQKVINVLDKLDANYLELIYQITKKHQIDPDDFRKNLKEHLNKLNKTEASQVLFALFSDGILHSEVIILNSVYKNWFDSSLL